METISEQIAGIRWAWLGHVLEMDHHSNPRVAITWVPEGKRKRGRPRETWRRTVERELRERGVRACTEAATAAVDRAAWREGGSSPIDHFRDAARLFKNETTCKTFLVKMIFYYHANHETSFSQERFCTWPCLHSTKERKEQ